VEGAVEDEISDDAAVADEAVRLRERVAELEADLERAGAALAAREARIEELEAELGRVRRERDDAREWATFLDDELREHRDRVETLESRVEALESRGLLDRLRGLFG
jgi:chromosome segregation ATPase